MESRWAQLCEKQLKLFQKPAGTATTSLKRGVNESVLEQGSGCVKCPARKHAFTRARVRQRVRGRGLNGWWFRGSERETDGPRGIREAAVPCLYTPRPQRRLPRQLPFPVR